MSECAQISLLTGLPELVAEQVRQVNHGKLTDERLRMAIVRLRGAGVPVRRVCEVLNTSAHTIIAAEKSDPELLATSKERAAEVWSMVGLLCSEALVDKLLKGELKGSEMGLTGGIALTKASELRGEATVRIEVGERLPTAAEIMERMRRASIPVSAVVVSSDSESGVKVEECQ